jgi:hypothetical protein
MFGACGVCRRKIAKISVGQEALFSDNIVLFEQKARGV